MSNQINRESYARTLTVGRIALRGTFFIDGIYMFEYKCMVSTRRAESTTESSHEFSQSSETRRRQQTIVVALTRHDVSQCQKGQGRNNDAFKHSDHEKLS